MLRTGRILVVLVVVLGSFAVGTGQAATYRYTDKDGSVGLADDLQTIPEAYRKSAVLISGDAKEDTPATGVSPEPAHQSAAGTQLNIPAPALVPAPEQAVQQSSHEEQRLPFSIRLAISIGVVIAAIFASVFLGKISAMHGHDRAIHILRVSLTWLIMAYLAAAHAKDVMVLMKMAGGHVQSVSAESAKKGEKAAKAIKAMDDAIKGAEMQVQEAEKAVREAEQATPR